MKFDAPTPARLLQPLAEAARGGYRPTEREKDQLRYIINAARNVFIQHGATGITLVEFACATGLPAITVRRQVCDMHHLFGLVLGEHLLDVLGAVCGEPFGPGLLARRRAAYFNATRGPNNVPTPLHFLLLRHRFALPEDELALIETARNRIADVVAGRHAGHVLGLLDSPAYTLAQIEAAYSAVAGLLEFPDSPQPALPGPYELAEPATPADTAPDPDPPDPGQRRPTLPDMKIERDDALAQLSDDELRRATTGVALAARHDAAAAPRRRARRRRTGRHAAQLSLDSPTPGRMCRPLAGPAAGRHVACYALSTRYPLHPVRFAHGASGHAVRPAGRAQSASPRTGAPHTGIQFSHGI